MQADTTGIILVGGQSQRMGTDKALLPVGGRPLYQHSLQLLQQQCPQVMLIGDRPQRFRGCRASIQADIYPGSSLGGLYTGLYHSPTPWILALSCDWAYPDPLLARSLATARHDQRPVVPLLDGRPQPLFALYHRSHLPLMEQALQKSQLRLQHLLQQLQPIMVTWPPAGQDSPMRNLNTPQQLQQLSEASSVEERSNLCSASAVKNY